MLRQYSWWFGDATLLHDCYTKTCKRQHKHEQKDGTKTLVVFPDHIFIDYDFNCLFPFLPD